MKTAMVLEIGWVACLATHRQDVSSPRARGPECGSEAEADVDGCKRRGRRSVGEGVIGVEDEGEGWCQWRRRASRSRLYYRRHFGEFRWDCELERFIMSGAAALGVSRVGSAGERGRVGRRDVR